MDVFSNMGLLLGGAVATAGLIQWGKGLVKKAPSWVWAICLIIFGVGYMYAPEQVRTGLLISAIAQLGYETLIQPIKKKVGDE